MTHEPESRPEPTSFESAADAPQPSLLAEILDFLRTSGKWWMLPIVVVLLLLGALILLGGTAGAPFLYTLF
ncbi:MAG: DUF5989 family protein [Isosphaeraceae bacterium]|nr:DUF5989 family protein [Isosphaeraceae bacterium]